MFGRPHQHKPIVNGELFCLENHIKPRAKKLNPMPIHKMANILATKNSLKRSLGERERENKNNLKNVNLHARHQSLEKEGADAEKWIIWT